MLAGLGEEGLAGQGQDFGVPQGGHGGGMGRAGDQGHFPCRLPRLDDADQVRCTALRVPHHAQPPGADKVQGVRRLARAIEGPPPRQGEQHHPLGRVGADEQVRKRAVGLSWGETSHGLES